MCMRMCAFHCALGPKTLFERKEKNQKKKEEGEEENGIQGNVDNAVCCASHEFGSLRSKIASENAAIQLLPATLQSRGLLAKEEA